MHIQSKLPGVDTTIFTVMSQLAQQYNAVNLGQGFPDFMMNPELISLVNDAMKSGYNQYSHMNGLPLLREGIAEKIEKLYAASFGANFVPFNNTLLSAEFTVKQLSYSFAFRIKHFRIAYINDNDWMVNQKRTGKSSILNGKIYGGFIFDFN